MPLRDRICGTGELCRLSVWQLAEAFRARTLSPVEAVSAALDRAEEINPTFNAFTFIDRENALAAAKASERRWHEGKPLSETDGIPATVKDIVWVKDWIVSYGSATVAPSPSRDDAPAVRRLRDAGVVFIGQTTTPEFGWKAVTDSPRFGITRNPWNRDKTPGGSSGGAAVAAATGAGVLHLGTDGGGSIRIPASFTGVVGMKPTFGRVPAHPASVFGTVAHIGPITRTAADAMVMLRAMSGRSLRDWAQGAGTLKPLDPPIVDVAGMSVGYWATPAAGALDPMVRASVADAVATLEAAGARITPVDIASDGLLDLFHRHWFAGAAARLALIPPARYRDLDPGFLDIAEKGATIDARSLVAAQVRRGEFGSAMDRLLQEYDFVVSPATAIPAFEAGREVPADSAFERWTEWAGFSFPVNLSQQPACVIPCGMTPTGLPVGFQIIGARGDDARVLAMAACLETIFSERAMSDAAPMSGEPQPEETPT